MTDPQQYVADQIGQQAQAVQGAAATETQIAQAAQSSAGIGVTEADIDAIRRQLADFQRQLNAQAAISAASPDDLTGSVDSLNAYLLHHGDAVAKQLGQDAAEAAKAAAEGGNTGALSNIVAKIEAQLRRNPPYPGENFHYQGALDLASHLPVVIDRVNAATESAPAKVVAGSVVG